MSILFIQYPPCDTCRRARKWLEDHHIDYEARHLKENPPTAAELTGWIHESGLPIRRFFNTRGLIYKEKHLKDLLPTMDEQEQIKLLATDGMLVKRPLIIGGNFVLVGFKEKEWEDTLLP